jgi:hypothetical protein
VIDAFIPASNLFCLLLLYNYFLFLAMRDHR